MKITHDDLLNIIKLLDNSYHENGLCMAYNNVWDEYYLNGNLPYLYLLFDTMTEFKPNLENLVATIDYVYHKTKLGKSLTPKEELFLDIYSLFHTYRFYMEPAHFHELTGKYLTQSSNNLYEVLNGGLNEGRLNPRSLWHFFYAFDSANNYQTLEAFLEQLHEILSTAQQPVVLRVSGMKHTVSLTCNRSKKTWNYVDSNLNGQMSWLVAAFHNYQLTAPNNYSREGFLGYLAQQYPNHNQAYIEQQVDAAGFVNLCQFYFDTTANYTPDSIQRFISGYKDYAIELRTPFVASCLLESLIKEEDELLFMHMELKALFPQNQLVKRLEELASHYPIDAQQSSAKTTKNTSLLTLACSSGIKNTVASLLKQSHELLNLQTNTGATPLHTACTHGYLSVVKELLAYKPDINIQSRNGATPLFLACSRNYAGIVKALVNTPGIDLNLTTKGYTPLHLVCVNGNLKLAEILINTPGIDLNVMTADGITPLGFAITQHHEAIIDLLIAHGAAINYDSPLPLLNIAVATENWPLTRRLVRLGAKKFEMSHAACYKLIDENKQELFFNWYSLIDDINQPDSQGITLLMYCCSKSSEQTNLDILTLLINKDTLLATIPQAYAVNHSGYSALDFALQASNDSAIEALLNACKNYQIPVKTITHSASVKPLKNWLKRHSLVEKTLGVEGLMYGLSFFNKLNSKRLKETEPDEKQACYLSDSSVFN